jgi:hypothetical protein
VGQLVADEQSLAYYFGSAAVEDASPEPVKQAASASAPVHDGEVVSHPELTREALTRVEFATVSTATPLRSILVRARRFSNEERKPLLVVSGRSRRREAFDDTSREAELAALLKEYSGAAAAANKDAVGIASSAEVRKCLGAVASSLVIAGIKASLLIVQSGETGGVVRRPTVSAV